MLWLRYHWGELAAVTVPTVLAGSVSPWFLVGTALAAGQWARHELHNRPTPVPPSPSPDDRAQRGAA